MRILLTTDTVGGVWTYALDLAHALARAGVEVVLAAVGPTLSERQRLEAAESDLVAFAFLPAALEWMPDPWADVARTQDWALDLATHHGVDLVHSNLLGLQFGSSQVPAVLVGHSCVLSWFDAVRGCPAPSSFDPYRARVTECLRRADAVVAPTATMLDALERHYGPFARATVIPNGRDPAFFEPGEKQPIILTAGRLWDPSKNVAALLGIASRVPWKIQAAGSTRAPGDDFVHALEGVEALGSLAPEAMGKAMRRAAIYALPARYEPFGYSALEAGLCRCALVLGDIPSLREVWEDDAVFVAPDDAEGLVAALADLIASPARREAVAARCRRRATAFTATAMARRYLSLYETLLVESARSDPSETRFTAEMI